MGNDPKNPETPGVADNGEGSENRASAFVPMRDESGRVTGIMDRTTADFFASRNGQPSQASLDAVLACTTRVRVTTLRYRDSDGTMKGGDVLVDTSDTSALESFHRAFVIDDPDDAGHLMTWPGHYVELLNGETPIAKIGWIIPSVLRWDETWKSDGLLRVHTALLDWMADQGRTELRADFDRQTRESEIRQREAAEAEARWVSVMPTCLRPWWPGMRMSGMDESQSTAVRAALRDAYPDPSDRIRVLLTWFGSGSGRWSGFAAYETCPESLLAEYETREIVRVLESDRAADAEFEGAARLFASWPFRKRWKHDKTMVSPELLGRLRRLAVNGADPDRRARANAAFGDA